MKLTNISNVFSRFGDLVLAFLVVCIIGLLIIPLPTPMVDLLIAINIMISTVMLMLSLYLPRALAFSTFPSMLLFTTLFRLALNVTTTRLILLKAELLLQRLLVLLLFLQRVRSVIGRGQQAVRGAVPELAVDAVHDAAQLPGVVAQMRVQPLPEEGRLDLPCVGLADRGDHVCVGKTALEHVGIAVLA